MPPDTRTHDVPPPVRPERRPAGAAARPVSIARRKLSSPDHIVGEILRGLYSGRYVPGQRLIEADLTRDYKVSRGSIREALKRLAAEGVVSLNLHRGAYIRLLSRAEVNDVLAVIEVLTGLTARLAAERIGDDGAAARMHDVLTQLSAARQGDFFEFVRARNRFYRRLLQVGRNRELSRLLPSMHVHLVRTQFRPYESAAEDQRLEDYQRIVRAVLAGDAVAAEEATRRHIRHTRDMIQRLPDDVFAPED